VTLAASPLAAKKKGILEEKGVLPLGLVSRPIVGLLRENKKKRLEEGLGSHLAALQAEVTGTSEEEVAWEGGKGKVCASHHLITTA